MKIDIQELKDDLASLMRQRKNLYETDDIWLLEDQIKNLKTLIHAINNMDYFHLI